ncbi:hypothetical protein PG984_009607 [Apiospora sp. TS-2023a]
MLEAVEEVSWLLELIDVSPETDILEEVLADEVDPSVWLAVDVADDTKLFDEPVTVDTPKVDPDSAVVAEEAVESLDNVSVEEADVDENVVSDVENEEEVGVGGIEDSDVDDGISLSVEELMVSGVDDDEDPDSDKELLETELELVPEVWVVVSDEVDVAKLDVPGVDRVDVGLTSTEELDAVSADEVSELSVAVPAWVDVMLPEPVESDSDDSVEVFVLSEFSSELVELCVGDTLDSVLV